MKLIYFVSIGGIPTLFLAALVLTGCTAKPVSDGYGSPKALFEAVHRANISADYETMLRCVDPTYRSTFAKSIPPVKGYIQRVDSAAKLIERKFGKKAAGEFSRRNVDIVHRSLFSSAVKDGEIQWGRLQIRIEGNRAWAEMDGRMLLKAVRELNGNWYWTFSEKDLSPEALAFSKGLFESGVEHINEIVRKVNAGEISEDYFVASRLDESTPWPRGVEVIIEAGKAKLLPGTDLLAEDSKLSGGKVVRMRPGDPFGSSGFIASIDIERESKRSHMFIVYAHNADTEVAVSIDDGKPVRVKLPKTDGLRDYKWAFAPMGLLPKGKHEVHVYAIHNSGVDRLDVVLFVEGGK